MIKIVYVMATIIVVSMTSCQHHEKSAGDRFYAKKDYKNAIKAYSEHIGLYPQHVKSIYNRGRSYEELQKYDLAEKDFLRVIDIDAKNTSALLSLAELKYRAKIYDKSRFYAEQAVMINEGLAPAYFWLGRSYHQLGEFAKALKAYNSAISLDATMGKAYMYRGAIYMTMDKKASGCSDLKKAQSLNVKNAARVIAKYCN